MNPVFSKRTEMNDARKSWVKKILAFYFFIFFIFSGILMAAGSPEELYREGNASYENGNYAQAVSIYEKLIGMDRVGPEVFYNLGNSYFKLKKIGKAILNYERALRLDPRDRDIRINLKLARSEAIDKIDMAERGFLLNAILFFYDRLSVNELAIMCSFFYLAIILLLLFSIFFTAKKKVILYVASMLGVMVFIFFVFLFAKARDENFTKVGIILIEKIDVRSGPKEDYLLQFTLHEGAKVRIVKKAHGWYEIDLSKDLKGWIPETSVDII